MNQHQIKEQFVEEKVRRFKKMTEPLRESFPDSLTLMDTVLRTYLTQAMQKGAEMERMECMRDVCMYCGGRVPQWHTEVSDKPNSAGNYVHIKREGDSIALCVASSIVARSKFLTIPKE